MGVIGEGSGTIVTGQRKLSDIGSTRKKPIFTGEFVNISGDVAPLYLMTEKLGKSKEVGQASYFHLETDWLPTVVTVNDATDLNDSDTALVVDNGQAARCPTGTILKVLRTGEMLRVTALNNSTHTLTVTRGVGGTTAAAILDNEEIAILSHAAAEGATSPESVSSEPTLKTNYCQTFRQALELSGRDVESDNFGPGELERISKDALESLTMKVEKAMLFQNGTGSSTDPTMTIGVEGWLSTNVTNVGGALTETTLIDSFITPWFRRNHGKKKMIAFAGEKVRRAIDSFGRDMIRYAPSDTGIGINVMKYRTTFGEIELVPHGMMTPIGSSVTAANLGWQGYLIGLNMELVGKRVFSGRARKLYKNRQTPDQDGIKWEWIEDVGLYLASEAQHALLKGVTN